MVNLLITKINFVFLWRMSKIPQIVKDAARDLIKMYGDNINYLGKYEGADAYMYHFPDDSCTGYPFVFLVKDDKVDVVTDTPALYITELFVEDVDKVDIE